MDYQRPTSAYLNGWIEERLRGRTKQQQQSTGEVTPEEWAAVHKLEWLEDEILLRENAVGWPEGQRYKRSDAVQRYLRELQQGASGHVVRGGVRYSIGVSWGLYVKAASDWLMDMDAGMKKQVRHEDLICPQNWTSELVRRMSMAVPR